MSTYINLKFLKFFINVMNPEIFKNIWNLNTFKNIIQFKLASKICVDTLDSIVDRKK